MREMEFSPTNRCRTYRLIAIANRSSENHYARERGIFCSCTCSNESRPDIGNLTRGSAPAICCGRGRCAVSRLSRCHREDDGNESFVILVRVYIIPGHNSQCHWNVAKTRSPGPIARECANTGIISIIRNQSWISDDRARGNYAWENQLFNNITAEYLPRQTNPPGANFATYLLRASSAEKQ